MLDKAPWLKFMFSPVTLGVGTVALTVAGLVDDGEWPWPVIAIACFMIIHIFVNAVREASIVHRLGRNHDQVQRRAMQVISDLGQLATDQFGIWMVDLYLPEHAWSFTSNWPFIERRKLLSRQLSVSLIDARPQPTSIDPKLDPQGKSYTNTQPLLWFDLAAHESSESGAWEAFDIVSEDELKDKYGVLAVSPLVDQLGKDCRGILAIHTGPERSDAFKALGALSSPQGRLRVSNACVDLHGLLGK